MPTSQRRRRRLVTTTVLARPSPPAPWPPGRHGRRGVPAAPMERRPLRAVTVQDPLDTGDAIADLRSASWSRRASDRRFLTVSARFEQPTARPARTGGRGVAAAGRDHLGPQHRPGHHRLAIRGRAARRPGDGHLRVRGQAGQPGHTSPPAGRTRRSTAPATGRFPVRCIGSPERPPVHRLRAAVPRPRRRHHRRRLRPGWGRVLPPG